MFTLPIAAAFAASVLATSFISGIFGMAGGMILMGLLVLMLPVAQAMLLHGVTQIASNGWRAWLWREHIRWRVVRQYALAAVVTAGLFALLPFATTKVTVLLVIGLTPLAMQLVPRNLKPNAERPVHAWICGAICTVLQLLAGVSGPILDMFFVASGFDRKEQIATKAAIQVFGHTLKIVYFGVVLATTGGVLEPWVLLVAIGFAVLGTNLSKRVLEAMSDVQFRSWTQRIIIAIASVYLAQGLYLLATG